MVRAMNCDDADLYIMRYMDGEITQEEAEILNKHILGCNACEQDFLVYDSMLSQFQALPEFMVPEGFELQVMTEISKISESEYEVTLTLKDKAIRAVWGTFTVLFGAGAILVFYREPIMNSLAQNPYVGEQVKRLMPAAQQVTQGAATIQDSLNSVAAVVNTVLSNSMGIIFGVLTVICAVQFYLLLRRKKLNKADEK